ncbi:hypothetical protein G6F63_012583 [Rhizopus arrhizus]|nr:hypothetical protein G6F63_012583 [Rhizopus arrhizus]
MLEPAVITVGAIHGGNRMNIVPDNVAMTGTIRTYDEGMKKDIHQRIARTAEMIAHWMRVGFVHGVMNTDNLSVLGLTLDYGPYGWVEDFDPDWTPNTTDAQGRRYRFGTQPQVAYWNLSRLAQALAPLFADVAPLQAGLAAYQSTFVACTRRDAAAKLGLAAADDDDLQLYLRWQQLMQDGAMDMTLAWRALMWVDPAAPDAAVLDAVYYDETRQQAVRAPLQQWLQDYATRLRADPLSADERAAKIASGLAAADRGKADLAAAEGMRADPDLRELADEEIAAAQTRLQQLEQELALLLVPRDPRDEGNLDLAVRAGTGGDEAAIFAGDLFRMYARYAERQGWKGEIEADNPGEHGGYKEVVARVVGRGAFSRLKFDSVTHRVQRVPATESQGRIHTSAATVAIIPEADEVDDIVINPADLKVDTFRSSGAGGQHVNKTESAVRITHIPTNIVVACQTGRRQHQNRDTARKMLAAKLYELEIQKRNAEKDAVEATKSDIGWGSQIRNYVLDQSRIKDLRTGIERSDTQKVLDGDLDEFVEASLKAGLAVGSKRVDA